MVTVLFVTVAGPEHFVYAAESGVFEPLVDLYQRALSQYGHPPLAVGVHSLGFVGRTDQEAFDIEWPHWKDLFEAMDRGWAPPTKERFRAEIEDGAVYLGSPETVATKIAGVIRQLGLSRFDLGYATGRVPHEQKLATIELYGREVIPRVRELLTMDDQGQAVADPAA